jgi:hypothetical protein
MLAYELPPDLDELLGVRGFGLRAPILVRKQSPSGWTLFGAAIRSLSFH